MRQAPRYPIESVDHALILIEILRDFGSIRLTTVARELGVSASTAHRLMAMLVYRGYAEQDASRRYIPGPALGLAPAQVPGTSALRQALLPHLQLLSERSAETANLMVLSDVEVRFLATVEGPQPLKVGDRQGVALPARHASGGKALLAALEPPEVERRFRKAAERTSVSFDERDYARLRAELEVVRSRGFAANFEGTEEGISAVGMAIRDATGSVVAAISASVPQSRFRAAVNAGLIGHVLHTGRDCERQLRDSPDTIAVDGIR